MQLVKAVPVSGIPTILLLLLVLMLTLLFIPAVGSVDMSIWLFWGENPFNYGLLEGYLLNAHEHPPGLTCLLWLAQCLANWLSIPPYYAVKLTFLPFLLTSSFIVYCWSNRHLPTTLAFHMLLVYSCMALSYIDIYFAPFFLWSFYSLQQSKWRQAMLAFTLACLIKYPPLIILPFLLWYLVASMVNQGQRRLSIMSVFLLPLLLVVITLSVFGLEPFRALERAFNHSILSAQALNMNWIITRLLLAKGIVEMTAPGDSSTLLIAHWQTPVAVIWLSRFLFASFYLAACLLFLLRQQSLEKLLLCSLLAHFSYFMFSIGAHENHLFLSMLLAVMLYCHDVRWWPLAAGICAVSSLNLLFFYGLDGHALVLFSGVDFEASSLLLANTPYPIDIRLIFAVFNLGYFLSLWICVLQRQPDSSR